MPSSAPALPCPFGHFRARSGTLHDRSLQHQPLRGLPSIAHVSTNLFVTFGDSRPPSASLLVTIRGSRPPVTSSPTFPGPFGDSRPPLSSAPAFRDCSGSSRPPLCNAVRAWLAAAAEAALGVSGQEWGGGRGRGRGRGRRRARANRAAAREDAREAEGWGEGWLKTSTPPCGSQWPCVCVCGQRCGVACHARRRQSSRGNVHHSRGSRAVVRGGAQWAWQGRRSYAPCARRHGKGCGAHEALQPP